MGDAMTVGDLGNDISIWADGRRDHGDAVSAGHHPFQTSFLDAAMVIEPVLGIVELSGFRRFVMADIPGLIEGAHRGAGLGYQFLKHIERTAILAHVLDIMPTDGSDPVENYNAIRLELERYSKALTKKQEVIIANKIDLDPDGIIIKDLRERLEKEIHPISAVTGSGTKELSELLWQKVKELKNRS